MSEQTHVRQSRWWKPATHTCGCWFQSSLVLVSTFPVTAAAEQVGFPSVWVCSSQANTGFIRFGTVLFSGAKRKLTPERLINNCVFHSSLVYYSGSVIKGKCRHLLVET